MKTYARIEAGKVAELLSTDSNIAEMFHPSLQWIEASLGVGEGWLHTADGFQAPAAAQAAPSVNIGAQIANLEASVYLNRGSRELELRLMEREAAAQAIAPATPADLLAVQPYYRKLKALDDQIKALRANLK